MMINFSKLQLLLIPALIVLISCQGGGGPETAIGCLDDYDELDPNVTTGQTYQTGRACAAAIANANNCTLNTVPVAAVLVDWALTCGATCRQANPRCLGTLVNQNAGTEACQQVPAGAGPGETPYWFMVCRNVSATCICD